MHEQKQTAYLGHIVTPVSFEEYREIENGALLVNEQGQITAVGSKDEIYSLTKPQTIIDFGQRLIMPGFVDLHVHLAQIAQPGRAGDTLLGWLEKYIFPAEAKFAKAEHARQMSEWFFRELAANGTTLSAVFTSIHAEATDIAFQAAAASGLKVIMGKVMMDQNSPSELLEQTNTSLMQSADLCRRWHGFDNGRLLYAFTPRFAPTSTASLMEQTARLWKQIPGSYLQTHLSENAAEIDWIKQLFPQANDYVDVYASYNLLGTNSLFAHAIHMSDSEIHRLAANDCAVAHCPSSNFFLKSGVFPYERVRKANLKFGLGSDIAAGPELSLFSVMKDAAYMQPDTWLSPSQLFYMSTLAGARAVNLQDRTGSLEPGKDADFIVVDPTLKSNIKMNILNKPGHDILSNLIYLGDERLIIATYVRGKAVYRQATPVLEMQPKAITNREA